MANVVIFADSRLFDNNQNCEDNLSIKSLGPFRIASEVRKKGFTCQVIFFMASFSAAELETICKKFIDSQTLVVGFSTSFWLNDDPRIIDSIETIINCTKEHNSKTKIIFGGPNSFSLLKIKKFNIDAVIKGYGEHAFINYFNSIVDKKEIVPDSLFDNIKVFEFVENSNIFDFHNSQTLFDRSDCLDWSEPVILELARGCIFKCKFCAYPLNGKKKLDYVKHADSIYNELVRNYTLFGIDKYEISDDTFNDNNEKLEILKDVFTALPFKINFAAHLRLDLINSHKSQIETLYNMGLSGAFFGIETFHKEAAKSIGKGQTYNPKQFLYDLQTNYWKNNVKLAIGLIAGLPYETLESYKETERWIRDYDNCLVENIGVSTLRIRNPKENTFEWRSEFETNSKKYGYFWMSEQKNNNSYVNSTWLNFKSPIKTSTEASRIRQLLHSAVVDTYRTDQGGFKMYTNYQKTFYFQNKKTFQEQLQMNRFEYTRYMQSESNQASTLLINSYKDKILSL